MGFFDKIKKIGIFNGFSELTDDFYDELEESLILADMGMDTTLRAVEALRTRVKEEKIKTIPEARACMSRVLAEMLRVGEPALDLSTRPSVVLMIGVNGVGKTTTIGKLGSRMKSEGRKVLFAAADTFRAAAADQLTIWVYDALSAAKARGTDVVLIDTAGRLHNKQNLMNELNKISRIVDRELPNCARETLLVLDATTGQNGLIQAKQFKEAAGITGIVLTKLDGTAKGGIAIAIAQELNIPVKYAGVGEGIDDLQPFDAQAFAEALI